MQSRVLAMLAVSTAIAVVPAAAQRIDYPRQPMTVRSVPNVTVPNQALPNPAVSGRYFVGQPQSVQSYPSRAMPNAGVPQRVAPTMGQVYQVRPGGAGAFQGQRWGGQVNGRWAGGYYAPGGWSAYRRPARGWTLPGYWISPTFYIGNYASYGLSTPPAGYRWSRYYDDAVLIDDGGRIYDTIGGLDWQRGDVDYGYEYADGGYDAGYDRVYASSSAPVVTPAPGRPYQGTYQGYQTADGYQGTYQGEVGYGAGYAQPGYAYQGSYQGSYVPPALSARPAPPLHRAPPVIHAPAREVVQPIGDRGSNYYADGYGTTVVTSGGYPGTTTTTVTVQSQPVVTTTTTEFIEETVYRAPRRVWRKPVRKWHPVRRQCSCACACK